MSLVPIYTPGWRETMWDKVPDLRKQHDGRDLGSMMGHHNALSRTAFANEKILLIKKSLKISIEGHDISKDNI